MHAKTHTCTPTYILSLPLSLSHTHTHTHTLSLSLSLSHTHSLDVQAKLHAASKPPRLSEQHGPQPHSPGTRHCHQNTKCKDHHRDPLLAQSQSELATSTSETVAISLHGQFGLSPSTELLPEGLHLQAQTVPSATEALQNGRKCE